MEPECTATSRNDTRMNTNMNLKRAKCDVLAFRFFFSFFSGGRRDVSRTFREQFCFIVTGLLCNDNSE